MPNSTRPTKSLLPANICREIIKQNSIRRSGLYYVVNTSSMLLLAMVTVHPVEPPPVLAVCNTYGGKRPFCRWVWPENKAILISVSPQSSASPKLMFSQGPTPNETTRDILEAGLSDIQDSDFKPGIRTLIQLCNALHVFVIMMNYAICLHNQETQQYHSIGQRWNNRRNQTTVFPRSNATATIYFITPFTAATIRGRPVN